MPITLKRLSMALLGLCCLLSNAETCYDNPLVLPNSGKAKVGLYIENLSTGEVLYDVNGDVPMIPASVTKALTSATILSMRPSNSCFETMILADGFIDDGVLKGDVKIKAVGDPTIESAYFEEYAGFSDSIVAGLKRLGIFEIEGAVVVDDSAVPYEKVPGGWLDEDIVWPYGAAHSAVNFKDNKFILTLPSRRTEPHVPGLRVSHTNSKGKLKVDRKRDSDEILSSGVVPKRGQSMTLSNPDPTRTLIHNVTECIRGSGIKVGDKPLGNTAVPTEVYTHRSPEFIDVLRSLMFRSDNLMAESMLRAFAPEESRTEAAKRELQLWAVRDVDTCGIVVEDGSGLSRNNRLTPYFLADIFVWMCGHTRSSEYVSLFPKAGMDGTMKNFLVGTPLEGRVAMKTGSMKGVQSYAGYLLDDAGMPTHVIVVMVNDFKCARGKLKTEVENLLLRTFAPGQ